jgi:tetratricopeptide (TPR) repeat protein
MNCGLMMRNLLYIVLLLTANFAFAGGTTGSEVAQILDQPEINVVGNDAEIKINFTVPVTYLRSFPAGPSDTVRIAFDIPDPCLAEQLRIQESKSSPRTNTITPFTLTFPEVVSVSNRGNATCRITNRKVDTNKTLLVRFDTINTYKIRLGDDNHSIIIKVPLLNKPEAVFVEPKFTVAAPPEGATSKDLLRAGKAAMAAGEYENATQIFNRLLLLPPDENSQEAQELVGNARDKNGDFPKAKLEYDLYLKLYPDGEGAKRVAERLIAIKEGRATVAENRVSTTKKQINKIDEKSVFGSLSQYYYGGRTLNETGSTGKKTRSTDQSDLVSSFDITGRWRHNQYDDKVVFRDAFTHKFPPGDNYRDTNRLNAAYWDHDDKSLGYMFRLGRQPGNSQGVLGRFDGGFLRYNISDRFRVTGVTGIPDNGSHSPIKTHRNFYGGAFEFGLPTSTVSGNVYAIQQNADGFTERRAIGTELRYFNNTTSWFGLVDYDTLYHEVNIALLQGNWTTGNGITFNALLDHRKSPILYSESGIPTVTGARSVNDLKRLLTKNQILNAVNDTSANADTALFGATKQITPKWQLGGDVRANRTSGTNGSGIVLAQKSSGTSFTYSLQAIGTNTIFGDDTSVINTSYIDDPHFNAQIVGLTNVATFRTKWHVTSSLSLYHEKRDTNTRTIKFAPTIRLSYQMFDSAVLEAELGFERSYTDDYVAKTRDKSLRENMFVGYRWDF